MRLVLPRLYVILDAGMLTEPAGETAQKLMDAGVKLLQYRAKNAAARELWKESREIAEADCGSGSAGEVHFYRE